MYFSPEQARFADDEIGPLSDLYALGLILYQMLTGSFPFQFHFLADGSCDYPKLYEERKTKSPISIPRVIPNGNILPESLCAVVMRALAVNPRDRFGSVKEFVKQLRIVLNELEGNNPIQSGNIFVTVTTVTNSLKSSDFDFRRQLIKTLLSITTPQFNVLAAILNVPTAYLPGVNAPHSERVVAFIQWAESPSGCGLEAIRHELEELKIKLFSAVSLKEEAIERIEDILSNKKKIFIFKPSKEISPMIKISIVGIFLCFLMPVLSFAIPNYFYNFFLEPEINFRTLPPPIDPEPIIPDGMILVPSGTFMMGDDSSPDPAEKPAHQVKVEAFYLDRTEVTNADYKKFADAMGHSFKLVTGEEKLPVTNVSWEEAGAYAKWVGKRLPTEEEWEYAARGKESLKYPWGNDFDKSKCVAGESNVTGPLSVGSLPAGASWCGALDMAGNVREWVSNEARIYNNSKANPSAFWGKRIIRGGAFKSPREYLFCFTRSIEDPKVRRKGNGIRCAKDLPR
jgi:formylglycine-generating enzyme required for sulfatase activity